MSPPPQLFDAQLERLLVATVIAEPYRLDTLPLAANELTDLHAREALSAAVNIHCRGELVDAASVRAQLQVSHDQRGPHRPGEEQRDLAWFDDMMRIPAVSGPPPVEGWCASILQLRETRQELLESAEPEPRKTPRGPRCVNLEPTRLAEAFRRYSYERDGEATLVRWARVWWRYTGVRYVAHDDELLDRDVISFLDVAVAPHQVRDPRGGATRSELRRVTSKRSTVGEVRQALTFAMPTISGGAPQWTSPEADDPPADQCVVCENGILNLRTLELRPPTPRLFATTALGCAWDPAAPAPTAWLEFLTSLWGDDAESILVLQQLFGYLLTADTSHQKIFALIGPPRSGKGTIARVLKALLGADSVVSPTLKSLENQFGLAPLVGKTVAIIGDARLGGHSDQQQVVERLLSISGEDGLSIDRKNRDAIDVRLRVRVVLLSNELPKLYDTSGALASRFVILTLSRSFLGEEDTELESKLLAELPGILRWSLEGREDLAERGRFVQPLASEAAVAHLRAISNPLGVFLAECCEIETVAQCPVPDLYKTYTQWCESNGRDAANLQSFSKDLHTLHPQIRTVQFRLPMGGKSRRFEGIRTAGQVRGTELDSV